MQQDSDSVQDLAGNVIPGAAVRVTLKATGALATLLADDEVASLGNPVYTDSNGRYEYKAANGTYKVAIEAGGRAFKGKEVTLFDPKDDRVNVFDFMSSAEKMDTFLRIGTLDVTAAVNAAWASAGFRNLLLPAGIYRVTDTLTGPLTMLIGEGPGRTVFDFENFLGKDGFVFQRPSTFDRQGGVTGLSIRAKGQNGRYAIATPRATDLNNLRPKYEFSNLAFSGMAVIPGTFAQDYGWEWMIDHGDCWGSYIKDIDAAGTYVPANNPATQPEQGFLRMYGLQGLLSVRITALTVHNVRNGIEIKDRAHWFMWGSDLADTWKGIYTNRDDSTTVYGEGTIQGVVVNAQFRGVDLEDRVATMINHLTVNRTNAGFDHGQEWIGLRLEDANKCGVNNLKIYAGFKTDGSRFGGLQVGVDVVGGSNINFSNYNPQALDRCFRTKVSPETSAIPSGLTVMGVAAETNIAGSILFDFQAARAVQVAGVTWAPNIAPSAVAQYGDATTARNVDIDGIRVFGMAAATGVSGRPEYVTDFGAAADEKLYAWVNDNGDLRLQIRTDTEGTAVNAVLINRTGIVVDQIELRGTALKFNSTQVGFYGATPIAKPTVSGSRGGNAALASVLTQLSALGLITDSTTA